MRRWDCPMNRQTLLMRLDETEHRISAAEARIAVLTDALITVSGETLWRAAAELRNASDAATWSRMPSPPRNTTNSLSAISSSGTGARATMVGALTAFLR